MRILENQNVELCFGPQNLGEFWNVSLRPLNRNGLGLFVQETDSQIQSIQRNMTLLSEIELVYRTSHRLLLDHNIQEVEVHDAHLAAVLEVHGVRHWLTLNGRDFKRFSNIIAIHPGDAQ
jgi:predicted nucleic acid-binding protein